MQSVVHDSAPAADALPDSQSVHVFAPDAAYLPASHVLQSELPFIGTFPAPHKVQDVWSDAKVVTLLYFPSSQATHAPPLDSY